MSENYKLTIMKELSIEEKAKAYNEAIEIAKEINNEQRAQPFNVMTRVFPELKEITYDDVMRKMAIKAVHAPEAQSCIKSCGIEPDDVIAWLEKQGDQKSVDKEYTFKSIPRLLDMIEPTDRAKSYCKKLIDSLQTEGYSVDAKIVGECLKQMNGEKVAMAVMDTEKQDKQKPQRMVSAEAKEALYDKPTDEEMKELLRTEYEKGRADTIAEMKSSWSEEDEKKPNGGIVLEDFNDGNGFYKVNLAYLNEEQVEEIEELVKRWGCQPKENEDESIISDLLDYFDEDKCLKHEVNDIVKWLKTIKPQPKQEWSEEDKIARKALINLVEIYYGGCIDKTEKKRLLNLLKSLRPQNTWKPSEEQMSTLNLIISDYYHACTKECDKKAIVLKSILEQLKQL